MNGDHKQFEVCAFRLERKSSIKEIHGPTRVLVSSSRKSEYNIELVAASVNHALVAPRTRALAVERPLGSEFEMIPALLATEVGSDRIDPSGISGNNIDVMCVVLHSCELL